MRRFTTIVNEGAEDRPDVQGQPEKEHRKVRVFHGADRGMDVGDVHKKKKKKKPEAEVPKEAVIPTGPSRIYKLSDDKGKSISIYSYVPEDAPIIFRAPTAKNFGSFFKSETKYNSPEELWAHLGEKYPGVESADLTPTESESYSRFVELRRGKKTADPEELQGLYDVVMTFGEPEPTEDTSPLPDDIIPRVKELLRRDRVRQSKIVRPKREHKPRPYPGGYGVDEGEFGDDE